MFNLEPIVLPCDPTELQGADENVEALDGYFGRLLNRAEQHQLAVPELIEKLAELRAAIKGQADCLRNIALLENGRRFPRWCYSSLVKAAANRDYPDPRPWI
jgi:hypothetical protein